jgi:oligo-1,6-glucosidase
LFSDPARHELSMVFRFEQVTRFWDEKLGKWRPKPFDVPAVKAIFAK